MTLCPAWPLFGFPSAPAKHVNRDLGRSQQQQQQQEAQEEQSRLILSLAHHAARARAPTSGPHRPAETG